MWVLGRFGCGRLQEGSEEAEGPGMLERGLRGTKQGLEAIQMEILGARYQLVEPCMWISLPSVGPMELTGVPRGMEANCNRNKTNNWCVGQGLYG